MKPLVCLLFCQPPQVIIHQNNYIIRCDKLMVHLPFQIMETLLFCALRAYSFCMPDYPHAASLNGNLRI